MSAKRDASPGAGSRRSRVWLLVVPLAVATLGWLGAAAYLMLNETAIVYRPTAYGGRELSPPDPSLRVEETFVRDPDSLALATWVIPPTGADTLGLWVLVCHGNAGNITLPLRQRWTQAMRAEGVGVVAFDYRGYGASDDGPLREAELQRDARAVYDWMVHVRGIPASRIVIYGHSLGSGVATHLAASVEAAGLIVEGAFTSLPDVGADRYPWVPVRLLARERFESVVWIGNVAMPKLMLHATDDRVIPFVFGQRLHAAAPAPKEFVTLTGGHDLPFARDSATYWGTVGRWLRTVAAPDIESPAPGRP